jgi:hypothetical protein
MIDQTFETTYAQMSDGELAKVLRDRRDLVPEAQTALDREIQKRNLDPSQLRKLKPHSIDRPWHSTSVGRLSEKIGLEQMRTKRIRGLWLLALIVLGAVFAFALDRFGFPELYWPIATTIAISAFAIWGHWDLRGRLWFWATIAIVIVVHAIFFGFVGWPWGAKWVPAFMIAGFWNIDLVAVFALIYFVEKLLGENSKEPPRLSSNG